MNFNVYIVLFFFGFILAIGLLAYASMQLAELQKRTDKFGEVLKEHYSKPLTDLEEAEKKNAESKKEESKEKVDSIENELNIENA